MIRSARWRRALVRVLAPLCLLAAGAALAQSPRLRVIGVEEGLPSSTVKDFAVDRSGYLWLATADGLARYDGVGFRVWRHTPGDPATLPGNNITTVHVDDRDRLWVAVEGRGFSMLDARRGRLRHYSKATHPSIGGDDVWAFASQGDTLWFGTYGAGLHRLDAAGRITRFRPVEGDPRSLPADTVLRLAVDARGRLWAATQGGLARWTGRDFERVALPGSRPDAVVYSVVPHRGRLWVGASTGLYVREADGRWHVPAWSAMFTRPNVVFDVAFARDGGLWIAAGPRLWRVAAGGAPVAVPTGGYGPPRPLERMLMQDDGALWVPVDGKGVGYLRPDWRRLSIHGRPDGALAASLYPALATARDGGVWLAGVDGEVERLLPDGSVERPARGLPPWADGRRWRAIAEDRAGNLWLGERGTLLRLDRGRRVRTWTRSSPEPMFDGPVQHLATAPDGTLWLASLGGGLQQRDPLDGRVLAQVRPGDGQGLATADIEAVGFDPAGRLWVADETGLLQWHAADGRLRAVPGIATGERVFGFAFTRDGGVWVHRLAGLTYYRPGRGRWWRADAAGVADGIPAVEGAGLAVDGHGRAWLATKRGLYRWDPRQRRVRVFGSGDGLASREFNDRALVLAPDGILTATLADGSVLRLDTELADPAARPAPLRVDAVETRRAGRWQPLEPMRPALAADETELRVVLRLLAYGDPRAHRYRTRLVGHDRDWVLHDGSDPGERVFAGLAPGTYTLEARAADATGARAAIAPLRIVVHAPWWRTPGALALFALAGAALAWALVRAWRTRARRRERWRQAERERELAHEASLAKSRFLATLGHEVRTPMTGVLGMSELLLETPLTEQQRGYTESIRSAGEHLVRLVNDALDLARIEAGRLDLADEPFDLHALVADVARFVAPLAQRRGLVFAHALEPAVPPVVRGDVNRVRQVLLNLLGNATKFTERGGIGLEVALQAGRVRFVVRDTGPGLGEEQRARLFRRFEQADGARTAARYGGSGLGLAICQELAAAMGGQIAVDSVLGQGTTFIVDLPLEPAERPAAPVGDARPAVSRVMRVLLVEDDPTVAEVLVALLRAQGHAVTHVAHGLAALSELATATFDLAFLDLDLPGLDGIALARQLRRLGFALPLVALTARADADAERECLDAGFDRFLRKPVTGAMLAAAIDAQCGCDTG